MSRYQPQLDAIFKRSFLAPLEAACYKVEMTLGGRIREFRQSKGISQAGLAEAIGVSVQAVSQWETDKTRPELANLQRIGQVLDRDVRTLLGTVGPGGQINTISETPVIPVDQILAFTALDALDYQRLTENLPKIATTTDFIGNGIAIEIDHDLLKTAGWRGFGPGDLIICDDGVEWETGDWVLALVSLSEHPSDPPVLGGGGVRVADQQTKSGRPLGVDLRRCIVFKEDLKQPSAKVSFFEPERYGEKPPPRSELSGGLVLTTVVEHRRFLKRNRRPNFRAKARRRHPESKT